MRSRGEGIIGGRSPAPCCGVPAPVRSAFDEACECLASDCPRAVTAMARCALEGIVVDQGETKGPLIQRLKNLADRGVLLPTLAAWSQEVRLLGNDAVHTWRLTFRWKMQASLLSQTFDPGRYHFFIQHFSPGHDLLDGRMSAIVSAFDGEQHNNEGNLAGLVGFEVGKSLKTIRQIGQSWEVDTWIMSCRVLGRRVEKALLQYLVGQARLRGITGIIGRYIPTAKNGLFAITSADSALFRLAHKGGNNLAAYCQQLFREKSASENRSATSMETCFGRRILGSAAVPCFQHDDYRMRARYNASWICFISSNP